MVETFASTNAIATATQDVQVESMDIEDVELRLLYDPFKPEEVETHELVYQKGKRLSTYLKGLPNTIEWMIFHNGSEVELKQAKKITVKRGDRIGLIALPAGGGGGLKGILRSVLQIAAVAVGYMIGGPIGAAVAAVAFSVVSTLLFPPKVPKSSGESERSYGIDGAKNSATEGIPYPVVYGEYRMAGNFSDSFTENVGDQQYLYLRSVLNDGEVDSISNIEINEQPIANFKGVQTRIKLGSLTQDINSWFRSSTRQVNKGIKLGTSYTTHITTNEVDQVRFDVSFPQGLVDISEKKGKYRTKSVTFEMEYRRVVPDGSGGYIPQEAYQPVTGDGEDFPEDDLTNDDGVPSFPGVVPGDAVWRIEAQAPVAKVGVSGAVPAIQYQSTGGGSWNNIYEWDSELEDTGYVFDGSDSVAGTSVTPSVRNNIIATIVGGNYNVRGVNGATVNRIQTFPSSGSQSATVSDKRTRAIRKTFRSQQLARGYYECRIRRTTAQSTSTYIIDEAWLTDVGEIDLDPVAMRGTANLGLKVLISDQLNSIPQVTALVKGSLVQKYDIEGTPTVKEWSNNPAWIGLDILCSQERGAALDTSRIDFPAWLRFAQYCEDEGLEFNGVFSEGTNIGDALRDVLRMGHAVPIAFGTRVSVAIDKVREPVSVITQAQMIEKSFQVNYMALNDRANEFEVTYYDKTDRNKAKTIRYVDPKAVTFNETQRRSSIDLRGVDNIAQARKELWRMIYANRLLIRSVNFETFMDSINLNIGDVALIAHDQMEWANNGFITSATSGTEFVIDQPVEWNAVDTFKIITRVSKRYGGDATVDSVVGSRVIVPNGGIDADNIGQRLTMNAKSVDLEVLDVQQGASLTTITVDGDPSDLSNGDILRFEITDFVKESTVTNAVANGDGTTTITVDSTIGATPVFGDPFIYGPETQVKKPYSLTSISGNGLEKRRLSFIEYNEDVYGPAEVEIPTPIGQVNDRIVNQVRGLMFDYERLIPSDKRTSTVKITWNTGNIRNYAGADILMRLNGSDWRALGSAMNVNEYTIQLTPNDDVEFQVVAFNTQGDRAPLNQAPIVSGTLVPEYADLDDPQSFSFTVLNYQVDATVRFDWNAPADPEGITAYQVQYREVGDTAWVDVGSFDLEQTRAEASGLSTGNYEARVRSISPTSSSGWVYDTLTVLILPGSIEANFNAGNDRNGSAIPAPTLPAVDPIENTINTDGSANVSIEWNWSGDEATIDGFEITVTPS